MSKEIINPCPYCGGKAKLVGRKYRSVVCTNCRAHGPLTALRSKAIEDWNNLATSIDNNDKEIKNNG